MPSQSAQLGRRLVNKAGSRVTSLVRQGVKLAKDKALAWVKQKIGGIKQRLLGFLQSRWNRLKDKLGIGESGKAGQQGAERGSKEYVEKYGEQGAEFLAKHGDEGGEFLANYGGDALKLPANQVNEFLNWKKKLTSKTQQLFKDNPQLWRVYADMDSDVRKLLTLCNSPCIPKNATIEQAQHIKDLIKKFGLPDDDPGLKQYLYLHRDDLTKALNDINSAADITELQARMQHLTDVNMPVAIKGTPDFPHEGPQATRLGRLEGGGEFEFLGNSSQGVEGYFTPTGSTTRIPVSLKDYSGTGKIRNLIGRINQNAQKILPADAGKVVLHAAVPQFKADEMIDFINKGPVKNMPSEGKFQKLIFDCSDGVVVVEASGVRLR